MKLQVWWIPQVPGKQFTTSVDSVEEGVKIMDVLAFYDIFQFENNIKPDYCNAGGLVMWDEDREEWEDWHDEATGEDNPRIFIEDMEGNIK